MFLIATPSKSAGSAILLFLACIAIAIFYIIAAVNDEPSVFDQQDTPSRRLSLIDPKTVEARVDIGNNSTNSELIKDTETLWFLGNSVSRIHAFAAAAMLSNGRAIGREEQKILCGAGGSFGGSRPGQGKCYGACGCMVPNTQPKIGFIWQQRYFDEQLRNILLGKDEHYTIREGDTVILNMGLDDIGPNRWRESILNEAPNLVQTIEDASAAGRRVLFRYTTLLCTGFGPSWFGTSYDDANQRIQSSNQLLQSYFESSSIMHMSVQENCRRNADHVHPDMHLAKRQVQQMMDYIEEHESAQQDLYKIAK